ncbi:MAG: hypothetical protein WC264_03950 [Candidatus Paceibacterota bacterium]|jgi:hypothetical protein
MKKIFKKIIFATTIITAVFIISFSFSNHAQAAANIFDGSTDSNWGTAANWSQGTVPTATDTYVTTFDATSPDCTVNTSARVANAIDFTNYTNTITMTYQITVSGNITLGASMGISGSGLLVVNATATLTSNTKTWPNEFAFSGTSKTYTLADDWDIDGRLDLNGATAQVINGQTIYAGGSLLSNTTGTTSGTTNIVMNGTGTWSNSSSGQLRLNLTFNTAGTITISGNVYYNTGTLTYTAGTMVTTGSTLNISTNTTLATNGMSWGNLSLTGNPATITQTTDNSFSGNVTIGVTTTVQTINGIYNLNVGGNFTQNGTTGYVGGTSTIIMNGTGTINCPNSTNYTNIRINFIFNTAGTITFGSNVCFATNTVTYTAGTVIITNSTFYFTGVGTLNLNGLTLNNFRITGTGTISLASGLVIGGLFSNVDSASHVSLVSSVGGTQRVVTLLAGATQNLSKVDATDIDSSAGQTIWSYGGVLSNATNWKDSSVLPTIAYVFLF